MILTASSRTAVADMVRHQVLPAILSLFVGSLVYALILFVPIGWVTYGVSTTALFLVLITALSRVNDIGKELHSVRWHVRRFALVLVACTSVAVAAQPWTANTWPTWSDTLIHVGFAMTWMTTPNMPPFWKFIAKAEEATERRRNRAKEPQL